MGRPGFALFVAVLLSTAVSAEPERPCPACDHGMARAEGPVAGAALYLCRFCEVAVRVRPDGREAVSYRVEGERREFDLVGGARLSFPVPGRAAPEEVIVPVAEAATAAAAGHPVRLPAHPVSLPDHPVSLPEAPVSLPDHAVRLPDHPVKLPDHAVGLPSRPVALPAHPVERPAHAVTLPAHAAPLPGHPVRLPGHPVRLAGHPVRTATAARAAAPERTVVLVTAPAASSRFFFRRETASVLR